MDKTPEHLQRLVAEIDGWLDLRCPERALERLDPLLADPRTEEVALTLRVRAFVAQKRHKEALTDIAALRIRNHDPEWLDLTEAWCRKRMQDLPGSIRCMEQLLRRDTKSAIGHFNLGCYLALSGEGDRALDEVAIACGIDPSFREMLQDEPDLDSIRGDARFGALMAKAPTQDLAERAAEADAFEEDMAEGFEEDLEYDEDDEEFEENLDEDDEEDGDEEEDDEPSP